MPLWERREFQRGFAAAAQYINQVKAKGEKHPTFSPRGAVERLFGMAKMIAPGPAAEGFEAGLRESGIKER